MASKIIGIEVDHTVEAPLVVQPAAPNPDITTRFERFDPVGGTWDKLKDMHRARAGLGLHAIGDYVYAVGGTDGSKIHDSVEAYDDLTDEWEEVRAMPSGACYFQSVQHGGKIYVVGGITADNRGQVTMTGKATVYDPDLNVWTALAPMPDNNSVAFGAAVEIEGTIYVLGGYRGVLGQLNSRVMAYSIVMNEWTVISDFGADEDKLISRLMPFVFAEGGVIYMLGGMAYSFSGRTSTGPTYLFNSAAYDPTDDTVYRADGHFREMPRSRFGGATASISDYHYLIGGVNPTSNTLRFVERFDGLTDPFGYESLTKMVNGRSSFAVAPSGHEYGDMIYVAGGVISKNDENFLRVKVSANPQQIRLDGKQTGAIEVELADENGDAPAEVLVRVYTSYSPSGTDATNAVLMTRDDIVVENGYAMTTLLPRSEDTGAAMSDGAQRSYGVTVSAVVIDERYIGESDAVNTGTTTGSGGGGVSGGGGTGTGTGPVGPVQPIKTYPTVIQQSQGTTASVLSLGFLSGFLSFRPTGDSGQSAGVSWFSDIAWLPVTTGVVDDNEGTYDRMREAIDRLSREDCFGGTGLLDAVADAGDLIGVDATNVGKLVYLQTDGEDNTSSNTLDTVASNLASAVPTRGLPVTSDCFRVVPSSLHIGQSSRGGSRLLDSLASITGGSSLYVTTEGHVREYLEALLTSQGFVGYGTFVFEIDLGEECRIESLEGLFDLPDADTSGYYRYSFGDENYHFTPMSDRVEANELVLSDVEGRYVRFAAEFFAAMSGDVYLAEKIIPPKMTLMKAVYHKKTVSHLYLHPAVAAASPHQVVVSLDAVRGRGSEVSVAATTQRSGTWEDYGTEAKPAVDNGQKIVIPIRQSLGSAATLEKLDSVDGFMFQAAYGKWPDNSDVRVLHSDGTEVPPGEYKAFPHKGYVVFNRKRVSDFVLSVANKPVLSVAAQIVNRVHGEPVVIHGGGYMYSDLAVKNYTSATVLPEAINLLLTPLSPLTSSTFTAVYTYYDVGGKPEKGTTIRWYINGTEKPDLQDLKVWDNTQYDFAKKGDVVYFTVQPANAKSTGRVVKSLPVRLGA